MTHRKAIELLHSERCSCVIANADTVQLCHRRGVADLLHLLRNEPALLHGAFVADKVIGKGAAALMVLGGVESVYADTISEPALLMLKSASVPVEYALLVPGIVNRSGTGPCPVEALCAGCADAADCLPLIEAFVDSH